MIDRRELLAAAGNLGLLPNVVEKDYVLGWLLAGIFNHPALAEHWVFKGKWGRKPISLLPNPG